MSSVNNRNTAKRPAYDDTADNNPANSPSAPSSAHLYKGWNPATAKSQNASRSASQSRPGTPSRGGGSSGRPSQPSGTGSPARGGKTLGRSPPSNSTSRGNSQQGRPQHQQQQQQQQSKAQSSQTRGNGSALVVYGRSPESILSRKVIPFNGDGYARYSLDEMEEIMETPSLIGMEGESRLTFTNSDKFEIHKETFHLQSKVDGNNFSVNFGAVTFSNPARYKDTSDFYSYITLYPDWPKTDLDTVMTENGRKVQRFLDHFTEKASDWIKRHSALSQKMKAGLGLREPWEIDPAYSHNVKNYVIQTDTSPTIKTKLWLSEPSETKSEYQKTSCFSIEGGSKFVYTKIYLGSAEEKFRIGNAYEFYDVVASKPPPADYLYKDEKFYEKYDDSAPPPMSERKRMEGVVTMLGPTIAFQAKKTGNVMLKPSTMIIFSSDLQTSGGGMTEEQKDDVDDIQARWMAEKIALRGSVNTLAYGQLNHDNYREALSSGERGPGRLERTLFHLEELTRDRPLELTYDENSPLTDETRENEENEMVEEWREEGEEEAQNHDGTPLEWTDSVEGNPQTQANDDNVVEECENLEEEESESALVSRKRTASEIDEEENGSGNGNGNGSKRARKV